MYNTSTFLTKQKNVLGYVSWGSNDPNSIDHAKTHNIWLPGSIAETAVSSSARTFNYPPSYADPDILFDRYTDNYNLAESYYMASQSIGWMDVIVGDPKTVI